VRPKSDSGTAPRGGESAGELSIIAFLAVVTKTPVISRSLLSDRPHGLHPFLAQYWWALLLRGALAIAIGLGTLAWPDLSFAVLLLFVATWFFADGVIALLQAFTSARPRWPHVLDASLSLAAGGFTIAYSRMAGTALSLTIAGWLMAKGITQAVIALRFAGTHAAAWLLGLVGIATAGFGAFLAHDPGGAAGSIALIASFAILLGLAFVALAWWFER
jgi:uncharacterized membrane protein HdeD (DUF308 family)